MALAFMSSALFNEAGQSSWPLFTTIDHARSQFSPGTAIMVAIGGWGDQEGFDVAASTDCSRKLFAHNVKTMVDATGADGKLRTQLIILKLTVAGVDIDWEYPG